MFSQKKLIIIIIPLIIPITNLTFANWQDDAKAIKVSGGEDHTLVLTKNKLPWGCGYNGWYQLGTGDSDERWTLARVHGPNNIGRLEDINDIGAGWKHSLASDANGFVWAWGNNEKGQLGVGEGVTYSSTPVQVLSGEQNPVNPNSFLRYIIAISAGRSGVHSLAVDANNFVFAWGYNKYGQCGNGESGEGNNELTPVRVLKGQQDTSTSSYLENIVAVSGGQTHSMALEKLDANDPSCNGQVYTFGSNKWPVEHGDYNEGYGKLGNASEDDSTTPVRVRKGQQDTSTSNYLENIVVISAGWDHCMALEKYDPLNPNYKGRVYTWGSNRPGWGNNQKPCSVGGRLGNGTYTNTNTPVIVLRGEQDTNNPSSYLKGIIAVAAGEGHSMAVDVNGFVYCWGDNYFGQLGNGTNDPCTRPVKVVGPDLNNNGIHEPNEGYLENIVAISAGFWHCLAIDINGTVWTWGKGKFGRLGLSNIWEIDRNIPHRMPPVVYNITQEIFYFGIQNAINEANNSDVIEASVGIYYENIDFLDKSITLKSVNPDDWGVVTQTIIDGTYFDLNLYLNGVAKFYSNFGSTLAGLTIRRNHYHNGIHCESSNPNIINCNIEGNGDYGIYCVDNSDPNIINCNIEGNNNSGILCSSSNPNIINCSIKDNYNVGIYCESSNATINHSVIERNSYAGLHCYPYSTLTLTNSVIRFNGNHGICLDETLSATIKNNWIHDNGTNGSGDGIYIYNEYVPSPPAIPAIIRNNTIVHNARYGIYRDGDAPEPNISNCIIWGNETGQLNCNASYSWTTDPEFMNPDDPNDLHISENSPCKNAGNPYGNYDGETDIDGENRVKYSCVDIGADEYYWSPADFDKDEIVNFIDYAIFANAWMSYPGDPNWNPNCDIATPDNNQIDYADLAVFCEDWLWQAGWAKPFTCGAGQGMGQIMGEDMSQTMTAALALQEAAGEVSYPSVLAEQQEEYQGDNQQQSMLAGEDETAGIWLVYDGNMMPNSGDEITVYIHSDPMLLGMGIIVEIAGDANITTAMCEANCNNYGWDNGWNSDPYIDPNGWLYINGVSWECVVNGTVGYFKFRYNSGEVTVSIAECSEAYDNYFQPVLFSLEPLIFGRDPNEQ